MPKLPLNRVAILTSHLSTGDAVSNDAVGMCHALRTRGIDARLFAGSWDASEHEMFPVEEVGNFLAGKDDLLIYHFSIEWRPGLELLRELKCRRAIKYHNVTPPQFFVGISLWHEEKCRDDPNPAHLRGKRPQFEDTLPQPGPKAFGYAPEIYFRRLTVDRNSVARV